MHFGRVYGTKSTLHTWIGSLAAVAQTEQVGGKSESEALTSCVGPGTWPGGQAAGQFLSRRGRALSTCGTVCLSSSEESPQRRSHHRGARREHSEEVTAEHGNIRAEERWLWPATGASLSWTSLQEAYHG